jgi:hypothetical protein
VAYIVNVINIVWGSPNRSRFQVGGSSHHQASKTGKELVAFVFRLFLSLAIATRSSSFPLPEPCSFILATFRKRRCGFG